MSRQFVSYPNPVGYRRSDPSFETASTHASRDSPRAFPTRTSPQHDNDSEKGEQQPRRRIGLAVRA